MRRIYTCFPGGRFKALTLSYDDGKVTDRRLVKIFNEYGLCGTFHLNSELLGETEKHRFPYVESSEVSVLYEGHEVACHTCTHPTLTRIPETFVIREVTEDRKNLEKLTGYPVTGMSYPNGSYDGNVKSAMKHCGISYSRTTKSTGRFELPDDYLEWNPTCHHKENLMELADKFVNTQYEQRLMLFYVWGHSYEFELDQNWELIEAFAERTGGRDDIWYASNIEIYQYMNAVSQLRYFADGSRVYNPTAASVWIKADGITYEIPAGQQVLLYGEKRPSYYLSQNHQILYRPCMSGEGKLDDDLVKYRLSRPEKTGGNPYMYLGEPVGDMRDNMYPQAEKLAENVQTTKAVFDGVPVKIYEPGNRKKDRPCLVFLHGGSFVGGSMEVVEEPCRLLSQLSGALVINVEYRLAPEYPFPAGMQDCISVIRHIYQDEELKFNRNRLYLGGDSAGGNLALGCVQTEAVRAKLAGLVLLYPVTDITENHRQWKWNEGMYLGGTSGMEQHCASALKGCEALFQKLYVQEAEAENPLISPINMHADETFPRTLLLTAEYDYLRRQGEAFGLKLQKAGADITMIRYGGMCHAFFDLLGRTSQAEQCVKDIVSFLSA